MENFIRLLSFVLVKEIVFCACEICLTWSIYANQLILSCKIDKTHLDVSFYDPFNQEQAVCVMSNPSPICRQHYSNTIIKRIQTKMETVTVLTISGNIDRLVNGPWTCRHGNNYETATVEVDTNKSNDVAAPVITANQSLPFVPETVVELVCKLENSGHTVKFEWDCFNVSACEEQVINCTTYLSKLHLKVSTFLSGTICECKARINNFGLTAQIKLDVQSRHVIEARNISMLTWILVAVSTITIAGFSFLVTKLYLTNRVSLERQIYYAAPQSANPVNIYSGAASNADNINTSNLNVPAMNYEDKDDENESVHYIELD